jgi:hypothetical protein
MISHQPVFFVVGTVKAGYVGIAAESMADEYDVVACLIKSAVRFICHIDGRNTLAGLESQRFIRLDESNDFSLHDTHGIFTAFFCHKPSSISKLTLM